MFWGVKKISFERKDTTVWDPHEECKSWAIYKLEGKGIEENKENTNGELKAQKPLEVSAGLNKKNSHAA